MATPTLATRLPAPLLREVQRFAKRRRLGPSQALRTIVAEWVATTKYPAIEVRDGPAGRRPGLRAGPDVWEVALACRAVGEDVGALREYFGPHLSEGLLRETLAFIAEPREEVEAWVDENERIGQEMERAWRSAVRA
jgi:hypothetical protein